MSWRNMFKEKRKEIPFLIFVSFLLSFLIARLYVYFFVPGLASADIFPLDGYVLHHLYYGIGLIIIAGWIGLVHKNRNMERGASVLYGLGLGLFFDEIGLMLTEFADYWAGITYTFVVIISLFLLNFIFFKDFWSTVGSGARNFVKKHNLNQGPLSFIGAINILDKVENKMPKAGKVASITTGLIFVAAGVLVMRYPNLIRYWVGGAFLISGIAQVAQSMK